jgi:hypothetical protein
LPNPSLTQSFTTIMQKAVNIQGYVRDETSQIINVLNADGYTLDDGATVVIPNGYIMDIVTIAPSDIVRIVFPPSTTLPGPASIARVDDAEANTSTLTFTEV